MQETPRHSLQEPLHFKPCLRHEHDMVLHPVLKLERMILSRFCSSGGSIIVAGVILPF